MVHHTHYSTRGDRSFQTVGPRLWNNLPNYFQSFYSILKSNLTQVQHLSLTGTWAALTILCYHDVFLNLFIFWCDFCGSSGFICQRIDKKVGYKRGRRVAKINGTGLEPVTDGSPYGLWALCFCHCHANMIYYVNTSYCIYRIHYDVFCKCHFLLILTFFYYLYCESLCDSCVRNVLNGQNGLTFCFCFL